MANKNKKKFGGPFRLEAIIPVAIICLLSFFYFKYFFDNHMRKAIEWGGTYANGAEVNVGSFNLSFLDLKLVIKKIQVTNKTEPSRNLIEIDNITFDLLEDAILRGKTVVPLAGITGIKYQSHRSHPGHVLPVEQKTGPSFSKKLESAALDQLEKSYSNNIIGDLLAIAKGQNYQDKLKSMENNLISSQKLKELDVEVKEKQALWEKRIKELPNEAEIKEFGEKIKAFKFDTSNPAAIKNSLDTLNGYYEKIKKDLDSVDQAQKAFQTDFAKIRSSPAQIQSWIEQDIKDLQNKLKIPSLNSSDISKAVFGKLFADKIRTVNKYMNLARSYMPAKTDENKKPEIEPHVRAVGKNFKFPLLHAYPKFWLQKAEISSSSNDSEFSGDLKGTLTNVTDDPAHLGKPIQLKVGGNFPKSNIHDINALVTVDHTTSTAKESLEASVGSFPVTGNTISKSDDVEFGYDKAVGTSKLRVGLENKVLDINLENVFNNVNYTVNAKDDNVKRIVSGISQSLSQITLNASAKGNWEDLDISLNSNLGGKIQEAFMKQVQAEVDRLKLQLKEHVDKLIGEQKEKLTAEIQKIEKQYGVSLKSKEDAINSIKNKIEEEKNKGIKAEQDKLKSKVEEEGKKLLDNLKIKF